MQEYLNSLVANKQISDNLSIYLLNVYKSFTQKYDYLVLSEDIWLKIFKKAIEPNLGTENIDSNIYQSLEKQINNIIKKHLINCNTAFLNNKLIKLTHEYSNYRICLSRFYHDIELLGVTITDEYYAKIKNECPMFNKILTSLSFPNATHVDVINLINGNYNYLYKVKPATKSIKWTKNTLEYIMSLSTITINTSEIESSREFAKIKYILNNYDTFNDIKAIYFELYPATKKYLIDRVIFNFKLFELENLISEYQKHKVNYNYPPTFIYKIKNAYDNLVPKKVSNISPEDSHLANVQSTFLYSYISNEKLSKIDIFVIDSLFAKFPLESKEAMLKYLQGYEGTQAFGRRCRIYLSSIKRNFTLWKKNNRIIQRCFLEQIIYPIKYQKWFIDEWYKLSSDKLSLLEQKLRLNKEKEINTLEYQNEIKNLLVELHENYPELSLETIINQALSLYTKKDMQR